MAEVRVEAQVEKSNMRRLGLTLLLSLIPTTAFAHVELLEPQPRLAGREGGRQLKTGPCGQTENARTTDRISVFEPGQEITVRWEEYIDHPGYFRIAFDVDGDDDFPIRANQDSVDPATDNPAAEYPVGDVILKYVEDSKGTYETTVTLPDVECDNCTLQLTQFMYDKVGSGTDNEYYFQCADIVLQRGALESSGGGGSSKNEGDQDGDVEPSETTPSSDEPTPNATEDSPAGCHVNGRSSAPSTSMLGLFMLPMIRRRRRRAAKVTRRQQPQ